jgi:hypothetical protein
MVTLAGSLAQQSAAVMTGRLADGGRAVDTDSDHFAYRLAAIPGF